MASTNYFTVQREPGSAAPLRNYIDAVLVQAADSASAKTAAGTWASANGMNPAPWQSDNAIATQVNGQASDGVIMGIIMPEAQLSS